MEQWGWTQLESDKVYQGERGYWWSNGKKGSNGVKGWCQEGNTVEEAAKLPDVIGPVQYDSDRAYIVLAIRAVNYISTRSVLLAATSTSAVVTMCQSNSYLWNNVLMTMCGGSGESDSFWSSWIVLVSLIMDGWTQIKVILLPKHNLSWQEHAKWL